MSLLSADRNSAVALMSAFYRAGSADDPFQARPTSELKSESIRGGFASIVSQTSALVLQLGSISVLARLLAPEDFGIQAMVVAITGFLGLFRDAGLSVAAVQRPTLTRAEA